MSFVRRLIELAQQLHETLRRRFDQTGVIGAQLLADLCLNLSAETCRGLSPPCCVHWLPRHRWLLHLSPLPLARPAPIPASDTFGLKRLTHQLVPGTGPFFRVAVWGCHPYMVWEWFTLTQGRLLCQARYAARWSSPNTCRSCAAMPVR